MWPPPLPRERSSPFACEVLAFARGPNVPKKLHFNAGYVHVSTGRDGSECNTKLCLERHENKVELIPGKYPTGCVWLAGLFS